MFQNIIVTESARNLRAKAREVLRGKWLGGILTVLFVDILLQVPPMIIETIFSDVVASNFANLYTFFVLGPFNYGLSLYLLTMYRTRNEHTMMIFQGFEFFFKSFGIAIFSGLFTFFWSLLFVFPGIMAAYSYSQAYYVLCDHPEYSALQCITESKIRMRGNRWKLFCLQLSFIGWRLLFSIPAAIYSVYEFSIAGFEATAPSIASFTTSPIMILLSIFPVIGVDLYQDVAETAFYEILLGNYRGPGYVEAVGVVDDTPAIVDVEVGGEEAADGDGSYDASDGRQDDTDLGRQG